METVLVTGAAGYLGSVLCPLLLKEGYRVRALDLYRHRNPGLLACCHSPSFEAVRGDCRSWLLMEQALKGVDWIIPLAGVVGAPACEANWNEAVTTNHQAVQMAVRLAGGRPVLYPNTNSGYGTTGPDAVCDEDTPLNPISCYAKTKQGAEKAVLDSGNGLSFRLATLFGPSPRMRLDLLVNDFTHRAVRDGRVVLYESHFRRNYAHVRDAARSFVFAMQNWGVFKNQVWNIGLPEPLTKLDLCGEIGKVVPGFRAVDSVDGSDPDRRDYHVSVAKAAEQGLNCEVMLTTGVRELVQAYKMLPPGEFANV